MSETTYAKAGHNVGGISEDKLRSLVERIERLTEEKKALTSDINDIFKEASSSGFDSKVLRQVVRLRGMDSDKLQEMDHLLDLYRRALGV